MDATDFDSLRDTLDNVRTIMQSIGFAAWKADIEAQMNGRVKDVLNPVESMDKVVAQEFMKGEIQGLMIATQYWNLLEEQLSTEVKRRVEAEDVDKA